MVIHQEEKTRMDAIKWVVKMTEDENENEDERIKEEISTVRTRRIFKWGEQ